jgi:hypothetical protein
MRELSKLPKNLSYLFLILAFVSSCAFKEEEDKEKNKKKKEKGDKENNGIKPGEEEGANA